jgi:long-chain acyl-CoA synthetase
VAVLVPDPEELKRFKDDQDGMHKALSKAVDRVNAELSIIEKVRRFIVADESFSVENEMLTPSMKIRRHVIGATYGGRLDALYKR